MRTPDAVQVAAALVYGADVIVTNDRAWLAKFKSAEFEARPWPALLLLEDYLE